MIISYKWLCEYLDMGNKPLGATVLADVITAIGLEVEDIRHYERVKGGLANVVVGQVLTIEKIPDTEKLKRTTVDVNDGIPLQIVCGAPNVAEGQKVIVALNGAVLYPHGSAEALKIKKSKIRGVESNGMICAEDEIGLSADHGGIMILPVDAPVGQAAATYLEVYTDTIFDIGLTPNRSDAFSHLGVAREVAAYLQYHHPGMNVRYTPQVSDFYPGGTGAISIHLDNSTTHPICQRFAGVMIKGISIAESPKWLKNKLMAIGVQSINNIVDITNFVLHETGQPLHVYDAAHIAGNKIIVRAAKQGEPFTLLDSREIKLHTDDIVVCNADKPMCLAGVYGGLHSGISTGTKDVFIESAAFDMKHIRRTSMRYNLRTDAALHFEKGTDISQVLYALNRAALLMNEIAGGTVEGGVTDVYPAPKALREITVTYADVNRVAGVAIEPNDVIAILTALAFEVVKNDMGVQFTVRVPAHKLDVEQAADIIEEVIRIYGFDNIPVAKQVTFTPVSAAKTIDEWRRQLSRYLSAHGFNEIVNNSIVNSSRFAADEAVQVKLLSYKNAGLDSLRTQMLPSVLDTLSYNEKRRVKDARVYEWGRVFEVFQLHNQTEKQYLETEQLVLAVTGNIQDETWTGAATAADWKLLKPFVEQCLALSGIKGYITKQEGTVLSYLYKDKVIARISNASKMELEASDMRQPVWYAVLEADVLFKAYAGTLVKFKEPSRFPSIRRDIALVIDKQVTYADIEKVIQEHGGKYLHHVNVFDVYAGDKIEQGKVSYAVSLEFNNPTQSLQDTDVNKVTDKVRGALENQLNAQIRK